MPRPIFSLIILFFQLSSYAQTPQIISYQAIARTNGEAVLSNQTIGVKFSVIQDNPNGDVLYAETHVATTNQFGLFNLAIGQGTIVYNTMESITWADGLPKFLKTELSATNNGIYVEIGTTQLLTVPYAFYTENARWVKKQNNNSAIASNYFVGNGNNNTGIGHQALLQTTFGINNTATGTNALSTNTIGFNNTATGAGALFANSGGSHNIAVGTDALYTNTFGNFNTAVGENALYTNSTGSYNTAHGANTLYNNITGEGNTAVGSDALYKNNTGFFNTATGVTALKDNTTGNQNTAHGAQALMNNATGDSNTATGFNALHNNVTGFNNTAVGSRALQNTSIGYANTAIGEDALNNNTTGYNNSAFGENALINNLSGNSNIAMGKNAMSFNTQGNFNIAIGFEANVSQNNLTNAIAIGKYAIAADSNTVVLGGVDTNAVKVGIGLQMPLTDLHIKQSNDTFPLNSSGGLRFTRKANTNRWQVGIDNNNDFNFVYNDTIKAYLDHTTGSLVTLSDKRAKSNIAPLQNVLQSVLRLNPVSYNYLDNKPNDRKSIGFIAQEVEPLFPDAVFTKSDDQSMAIAYQNFTILAIQAIKEQQEQIEELKQQNETLIKRLDRIEQYLFINKE